VQAFGRVTLCEQEPPGSRATPCLGDKLCFSTPATQSGGVGSRTKQYVLVPALAAYGDAVTTCNTLHGSLLVLDSREEREQVAVVAASLSPNVPDYWLGLTRGKAGVWSWSSPLDPSEVWATDEPVNATGTHAYVDVHVGKIDSSLAHVAGDAETHFVICEM
jgi:hypothetical protein